MLDFRENIQVRKMQPLNGDEYYAKIDIYLFKEGKKELIQHELGEVYGNTSNNARLKMAEKYKQWLITHQIEN